MKNYYTNPKKLELALSDYAGGVALWGALPAIFDTKQAGFNKGVHVHARHSNTSKKVIDETFSEVIVYHNDKSYLINEDMAVAYTMSSIFNVKMYSLSCEYCGKDLLDRGLNAVRPSYQHHCVHCNKKTHTKIKCIANPIVKLKYQLNDYCLQRPSIQPNRTIKITQQAFPGGYQVWGSNPSIIWTSSRLEESAIHVHAYNVEGRRVIDNTYSHVTLENKQLDIEMIRLLQIQACIAPIKKDLVNIVCPNCAFEQFDRAEYAVLSHSRRTCTQCQTHFISKPGISNPASSLFDTYSLLAYEAEIL